MVLEEIQKRPRSKRRLVVIPFDEFTSMLRKAIRDALNDAGGARRNCPARLLSKREAARQLGIDRATTLQRMIDRGEIRTVKLAKRVRIPVEEIERIIGGQPATTPEPRSNGAPSATGRAMANAIRALKIA